MPAVLTTFSEPEVIPRLIWTRAEVARLEQSGTFGKQRVELIHGDLIRKMPKKRLHVNCLRRLANWAEVYFGRDFVNTESPIDVAPEDNPSSEPEPDLVVLNRSTYEITESNPVPEDIRLVVEIADSSLSFDLRTKAALYARAGIAEYWVVDLNGRRLIIHRDPQPSGNFSYVMSFLESETVYLDSAPQAELLVGDLF